MGLPEEPNLFDDQQLPSKEEGEVVELNLPDGRFIKDNIIKELHRVVLKYIVSDALLLTDSLRSGMQIYENEEESLEGAVANQVLDFLNNLHTRLLKSLNGDKLKLEHYSKQKGVGPLDFRKFFFPSKMQAYSVSSLSVRTDLIEVSHPNGPFIDNVLTGKEKRSSLLLPYIVRLIEIDIGFTGSSGSQIHIHRLALPYHVHFTANESGIGVRLDHPLVKVDPEVINVEGDVIAGYEASRDRFKQWLRSVARNMTYPLKGGLPGQGKKH